jgi:hypothetical protein
MREKANYYDVTTVVDKVWWKLYLLFNDFWFFSTFSTDITVLSTLNTNSIVCLLYFLLEAFCAIKENTSFNNNYKSQ